MARPGQTGIKGPFRARALLQFRAACPNMVRLRFLCGFWRQASGSLAYAENVFLAAGAAWKLTSMLSDFSAELARLGLSLCTEIGKCAWLQFVIDDLLHDASSTSMPMTVSPYDRCGTQHGRSPLCHGTHGSDSRQGGASHRHWPEKEKTRKIAPHACALPGVLPGRVKESMRYLSVHALSKRHART